MTLSRATLIALGAAMALVAERQPLEFSIDWVNTPKEGWSTILQHRTFQSQRMKREVGYSIFLPPDYETSGRRYPVIYWLHGAGETSFPARALLSI